MTLWVSLNISEIQPLTYGIAKICCSPRCFIFNETEAPAEECVILFSLSLFKLRIPQSPLLLQMLFEKEMAPVISLCSDFSFFGWLEAQVRPTRGDMSNRFCLFCDL